MTRPLRVVLPTPARPIDDVLPTFGIEEEFLLLQPDGDAACVAPEVLGRLPATVPAHPELTRYQVEVSTGICVDLATAARELSAARRALAEAAAESGARLVAAGTAPFGAPGMSGLTDDARYRDLVTRLPGVSGDEGTCACHVHVGVASREIGVRVLNRIRPWLPVLLAVSGNSPLWRGRAPGWSSYRFVVQRRWPTFEQPPVCRDAAEYDRRMTEHQDAGLALDASSVYYWARLSPRYPTVEIRIGDVGQSVADAVLLAGLCRSLVATALVDAAADRPWVSVPERAVNDAALAAARRGLAAVVVSPLTGRPTAAREVLAEMMAVITPAADAEGEGPLLRELLSDRIQRGSGAERQVSLWRSGGRQTFVQALADASAGVSP